MFLLDADDFNFEQDEKNNYSENNHLGFEIDFEPCFATPKTNFNNEIPKNKIERDEILQIKVWDEENVKNRIVEGINFETDVVNNIDGQNEIIIDLNKQNKILENLKRQKQIIEDLIKRQKQIIKDFKRQNNISEQQIFKIGITKNLTNKSNKTNNVQNKSNKTESTNFNLAKNNENSDKNKNLADTKIQALVPDKNTSKDDDFIEKPIFVKYRFRNFKLGEVRFQLFNNKRRPSIELFNLKISEMQAKNQISTLQEKICRFNIDLGQGKYLTFQQVINACRRVEINSPKREFSAASARNSVNAKQRPNKETWNKYFLDLEKDEYLYVTRRTNKKVFYKLKCENIETK